MFSNKSFYMKLFSLVLLIFALIAYYFGYFDLLNQSLFQILRLFSSTNMTSLSMAFSLFGSMVAVSIICIIQFIWKPRKGIYLFLLVLLTFIINLILRNIFIVLPPDVESYVIVKGYSFPSEYAMISFSLFGFLIMSQWKRHKFISMIYVMIIILVGISRIYLGVNYLSDVIIGYLFSLVLLTFTYPFIHKNNPLT